MDSTADGEPPTEKPRAGMRKVVGAQPYWERAERRLRQGLRDAGWKSMKEVVSRVTEAAAQAGFFL
jgi:hypothetical protein